MKRRGTFGISAWFVLTFVVVACGSLNSGDIVIVDGDGSASGKSGGGTAGTTSSAGTQSSGGTSEPIGGAAGGEGGEPPVVISDDPPTVVAISPEDEEEDVEPTVRVVITFSESLDEDTLDDAIVVKDGEVEVNARLTFAGTKATLTFPRRLDLLATYTVDVGTAVTDLAGIPLENAFSSSFTVRDGKWGSFVTLNNPTDTTGRVSSGPFPRPVFDGAGNALAVWSQAETSNGSYAIWGRAFSASKGWQAPVKISSATTTCDRPSVAMNSAGDAVVAWRQDDGSYARVAARRYVSGTWEAMPQRVDVSNATDVSSITTAMTETGDAHVLWTYQSTYRYVAGNTANGTGAWNTSDTYINGSFDSVSGPEVAFNEDGAGFAVWAAQTSDTMTTVRVARYLPATGWGNIETIVGSAGASVPYESSPGIVADASGGAMASWLRAGDVATSRFTKATGWSAIVAADGAATGSVQNWTPRLAAHGNDIFAHWQQSVGNLTNAFANKYTGTTWGAQPALLSDGDTSVFHWSDTGFGLDRHGNGIATWVQGMDVRFARLVGASEWQTSALVQTLTDDPTEQRSSVAANGMAAVIASTGYPYYERHDDLFAAVFQ